MVRSLRTVVPFVKPMIIEHEIIEQIEEEPNGRPLDWVCALARQHGKKTPLLMLEQIWRAGYVALRDAEGPAIPRWKCEEIFRLGQESERANVVATSLG